MACNIQIIPPGGSGTNTGIALSPRERIYKITYSVPAAAPGGTWTIVITGIWDGLKTHPLPDPEADYISSNSQSRFGVSDYRFSRGKSISTTAAEESCPRVVQLRIQDLKAAITSYQEANQQGRIPQVLRTNVDDALKALQTTETEFEKLATAQGQAEVASGILR